RVCTSTLLLSYSSLLVTTVTNEYRIEAAGSYFIVIDPWGERLVDDYPLKGRPNRTSNATRRKAGCGRLQNFWWTRRSGEIPLGIGIGRASLILDLSL